MPGCLLFTTDSVNYHCYLCNFHCLYFPCILSGLSGYIIPIHPNSTHVCNILTVEDLTLCIWWSALYSMKANAIIHSLILKMSCSNYLYVYDFDHVTEKWLEIFLGASVNEQQNSRRVQIVHLYVSPVLYNVICIICCSYRPDKGLLHTVSW